jgi:hypothetical protein
MLPFMVQLGTPGGRPERQLAEHGADGRYGLVSGRWPFHTKRHRAGFCRIDYFHSNLPGISIDHFPKKTRCSCGMKKLCRIKLASQLPFFFHVINNEV